MKAPRTRKWAEWVALVSGVAYLPLEFYELCNRATWVRGSALIINGIIVLYLVWVLYEPPNGCEPKPAETIGP